MPGKSNERLDYRTREETSFQEQRMEAMDSLWEDHSVSKEHMDTVIFGERRGGDDDASQTQWKTIQDGMAQEKLDDKALTTFAQATADYLKDTRKDFVDDRDRTQEYLYRDDLLMEKVENLDANLAAHCLERIAERSNWYPLPGDQDNNFRKHIELAQMARRNQWAQIPERLREMHQEITTEISRDQTA